MSLDANQVLSQVMDKITDPSNPALRVVVISGGGGGGGTVAVSSIAAGDNNIGNVDIVSFPSGTWANMTPVTADYDTGAGVSSIPYVALAKPASGGPVEFGTSTDPLRVDPTGTTTQPVSIAANVTTRGAAITTPVDTPAVTMNTGSQQIIAADTARLLVTFRNTGSIDCWIQHTNAAQLNRGFFIKANGGERSFAGGAAARQWFGITASSSTTIVLGGGAV